MKKSLLVISALVMVLTMVVSTTPALAAGTELYYDDGTSEALASTIPSGLFAVRFTPTSTASNITQLSFYNPWANSTAPLKVMIFNATGESVFVSGNYSNWIVGWNTIDLSGASIPIVYGDFYAGLQYQLADSPKVGQDQSAPDSRSYVCTETPYVFANPSASFDFMIRVTVETPRSNDNFADAAVITGASGNTTGNNTEATMETGEPFHSQYSSGICTVWWSWTAPTTGTVAFDTLGTDFDTVMSAYTGNNVSSLTLLSESDDAYPIGRLSRIVFKVAAGVMYHIAVAGYNEFDTGDITLNWGYATAPANDDFPGITISGTSGSSIFSSVNATREEGEPLHSPYDGYYAGRSSLWWSWTAPSSANVTFNTNGSVRDETPTAPDTVLAVYTGGSVGSLSLVDYSDWGAYEEVTFSAFAGTTYRIAIDGYDAYHESKGSIHLNWSYEVPAFTSATSTFFSVGTAGSFDITTSASPAVSSISIISGTLPTGVNFTDDGDGTATLSGTPAAGTGSAYSLTFSANNTVIAGTQNFTLTVNEAPAFVSASSTNFTVAAYSVFNLATTGYPSVASISLTSGSLPLGISYNSAAKTISGTPAAGTVGTYPLVFSASNGMPPDASQNFTLTVNEAPAFTSATSTVFSVGTAGSFDITTSASPAVSSISIISGTLPTGVNFTDDGDGTATLSGTPAAGTGNAYSLTFSANNTLATGTQNFTLTVGEAPAFVSASSTNFTAAAYSVFNLATTGYPSVASISITSGTLPTGVNFTDDGDGTATLSGTPAAGTGNAYSLTFSASNGISPVATQNFTLTVNETPAFTSASGTTFTRGVAGTFSVTATGYPAPSINLTSGTPPSGVTYESSTGILSGTPTEAGVFTLAFVASNGVSPNASQNFTLNVNGAPNITTPPQNVAVEEGQNASFTVIYNAYPAPTFQWQVSSDGGGRWSNIKGASSATYDISATTGRMSGNLYRVIVSNSFGPTTSDPATLTVMPGSYTTADVSIDKTDGVYDSLSGTISWNITVTNSGPGTAEGVTVADSLARGTRFSSITGVPETQLKVKGSSLTVTIGSLINGDSFNFTIIVRVTRATSPVSNSVTATVGPTNHDPDLSNNTDSGVCSWS